VSAPTISGTHEHPDGSLSGRSPDANAVGGDAFRLWQIRRFAELSSARSVPSPECCHLAASRAGSPPFF